MEKSGRQIRYHGLRSACSNASARAPYKMEERHMTITTPNAKGHEHLGVLASRYVDVASLPWVPTRFEGVELKILMEDKETGLLTALTRFAPGTKLPDHEHTEVEQSYVLEGSLADHEGVATAGNYVWRPAGSRHNAHSPNGAIVLSLFLQPNQLPEPDEGHL